MADEGDIVVEGACDRGERGGDGAKEVSGRGRGGGGEGAEVVAERGGLFEGAVEREFLGEVRLGAWSGGKGN